MTTTGANTNASEQASKALEIANQIRPLLAGQQPETQGAVLAELLSLWIAGWAPSLREEVLMRHMEFVRNLVESSEKELFGETGHPGV